ncbi:hypothetical protein ACYOEI_04665 [Singulisphaera rosea]
MGAIVWPFLIYWLVLFVACFSIVEFGQDQLYDEVTPHPGLKVGLGSLILAAVLTWIRSSFDTMFTSDLPWTVLQAIVWFGVFTLILQFHPTHAFAIGVVAMLLIPGLATMGVHSLMTPRGAATPTRYTTPTKPIRKPLGSFGAPPKAEGPKPGLPKAK